MIMTPSTNPPEPMPTENKTAEQAQVLLEIREKITQGRTAHIVGAELEFLLSCIDHYQQSTAAQSSQLTECHKYLKQLGDVLAEWWPELNYPHTFPVERAIVQLRKLKQQEVASVHQSSEIERLKKQIQGMQRDHICYGFRASCTSDLCGGCYGCLLMQAEHSMDLIRQERDALQGKVQVMREALLLAQKKHRATFAINVGELTTLETPYCKAISSSPQNGEKGEKV